MKTAELRNPNGVLSLAADIAETILTPTTMFRVVSPADHFRSRPMTLEDALAFQSHVVGSRIAGGEQQ